MTPLVKILLHYGVCDGPGEAVPWAESRPSRESLKASWEACERGDWLLWLVAKAGVDRRKVVLAACKCARLSLRYVPKGETRPLTAIRTAEAWCHGKATIKEVRTAAYAAYAASDASAHAAGVAARGAQN